MLWWSLLLACAPAPFDPFADGAYAVGHQTTQVGDRTVEVWYPTEDEGAGTSVSAAFLADPAQAADYDALLAAAPAGCPSTTERAIGGAAPAEGPFPLVVFSHCHGCVRFSSFSVMERLASHGYVVAAPDHAGNTLWDERAGALTDLSTETLDGRVADQVAVLDAMLSGAPPVDVQIDPDAVGAMGHSFGSVTTGRLAQTDARVKAALGVAAPMQNPLFPSVDLALVDAPLLFLLAQEDHSITELGNLLLRDNATSTGSPLLEVADAGHWSFSDIAGLTPGFMPGCGDDERQTGGEPFSYLPLSVAQDVAGAAAVTFFEQHLRGREGAVADAAWPAVVTGP